ncbi:MAG: precorrin-6y C5,15-methyltransferase (decarboxylating) subunit CbiE [Lachnospiraceae bacterium]|nr:precorrin-6y C5,15-methyltransferase (decarboxylating) subunit CbiE [Lachnospiraceae bacterium]
MKKVLIYAGTTEGRELAQELARERIYCDISVATEYGRQIMDEKISPYICILQGRMTAEQMRLKCENERYLAVVDATHPFATEVSVNIRESLKGLDIPYFRLGREKIPGEEGERQAGERQTGEQQAEEQNYMARKYFQNTAACVEALKKTEGKIFLTTGSKELSAFCREETIRKRLVVRVLPGMESLQECVRNGLEGRQIIAMQGPFSKEMNLAMIRQYQASVLVTKESGKTGGEDTKLAAAGEAQIPSYIILRPDEKTPVMDMDEVLEQLRRLESVTDPSRKKTQEGQDLFDLYDTKTEEVVYQKVHECQENKEQEKKQEQQRNLQITLAGIGMGAEALLTEEVRNRIAEADYVFGAKRMVESIKKLCKQNVKTYNCYLSKDIIPLIENIQENSAKIVILFSGDTGFYSGCEKLYNELCKHKGMGKAEVLPGISSLSVLSARTGISWQDAKILSTHGVEPALWKSRLLDAAKHEKKTFFLTSGVADVEEIGNLLSSEFAKEEWKNLKIYLGYQLSYPQEWVRCLTVDELCKLMNRDHNDGWQDSLQNSLQEDLQDKPEEGLYAGMLINEQPKKHRLTPGYPDDVFIRGQVPMTKEEVRSVSICKLHLTEDAVVYDIGSGTGSVSVEIAALSPRVQVYAMEVNGEAVSLLEENCKQFGLHNVRCIRTKAPDGLEDLPVATHAFIGGSKGNLREILWTLYRKNNHMRIVVNAVSMETICQMQELLKELPVEQEEILQLSVTKTKQLGGYHMLQAANPVYIYAFTFAETSS